jgi:hypothetical protein
VPYTLAHPAIILPLHRFMWLTLAGLFIGALSPDFEHILRLNVVSTHSHTLPGLLYFCLPVGFIVVWLYRSTWIYALTDYFEIAPANPPFWKDVVSVLIGACSHLFWDSFTHEGRWGVRTFPILNQDIAPGMAFWHLMQLTSSVIGLAILTVYFWSRARRLAKFTAINFGLVAAALVLTLVIRPRLSLKMLTVHASNNYMAVAALALTIQGVRRMRETASSKRRTAN